MSKDLNLYLPARRTIAFIHSEKFFKYRDHRVKFSYFSVEESESLNDLQSVRPTYNHIISTEIESLYNWQEKIFKSGDIFNMIVSWPMNIEFANCQCKYFSDQSFSAAFHAEDFSIVFEDES